MTSKAWEGFGGFNVETDAAGRYEFIGAPPGRCTLAVGITVHEVDLVEGGSDVTVDFDLPPAPAK